ncbi:hybrid sensor histidine kinase/response regulator [Hydrogenimonas thermophila]|uniref:Histidine kinase-, DNA gyrase B-, and HSP90-like ATPase n=1 Tax=Hydrogenimonas thermophila TaxID=223786 RepID=A0A1I5SPK4_9BACT|nr:hybrid sensor histidine kinase/response regulator [Hydrogenimonas thermophila]SFP72690.1 Histidine kinase-, DNA gyrase B-, and HSP90-like ATPase [Hydrogenimonas thermophila]
MNSKPYILAVDDIPSTLEVLTMALNETNIKVVCTGSGIEALKIINDKTPDLILLDILMPKMNGFEVCKYLKSKHKTKNIPIIFLSALNSTEEKIKAFEAGGVDYITKPFNILEVLARVKTHLKIHRIHEEMNNLIKESFHEIYTPLGMIKSSLTLQEIEYGKNEYIQNIKVAMLSLHSIYEDIYYAIKKDIKTYPVEWINIENFLLERVELFKPQMNTKHLKYNLIFNTEDAMIKIHPIELERIIDNLLSNAIKYSKESSIIQIIVSQLNEKIEIIIANESKKIKDIKQLFNELYREDQAINGLGIGLNIVKKICDKYHININVVEKDGTTRFILQFKENQ